MADNITLTSMSGGSTVGADEISSVYYQRIKLIFGVDGSNAGDVSDSNPFPVDDAGGTLTVDDGGTSLTVDGTVTANIAPTTSGGLSVSSNISTGAVMTLAAIKASAGQVYGYDVYSIDATPVYLKIYNIAGTPTSSDTPILRIGIPSLIGGGTTGNHFSQMFENGIACSAGISARCVTGIADNDTGVLTANEVIVNILYK